MSANDATQAQGKAVKAFENHLFTIAAHGQVSLAIALGCEVGFFKALASVGSSAKPATAEEVAKEAKAKPRYVREWLATMACAYIIEVDKSGKVNFFSHTSF